MLNAFHLSFFSFKSWTVKPNRRFPSAVAGWKLPGEMESSVLPLTGDSILLEGKVGGFISENDSKMLMSANNEIIYLLIASIKSIKSK